ncbi:MAG: nuclear transport factor 2 family protein [Mycobacterium sp.]|nr:nuclear transport factor 2 family protein [Mycobacterium sp.]
MTTSEIATALAWIDALNERDLDTLDRLSSGDIEIGDAHGATQGRDALRAWATDLDEKTTVGRVYVHDGVVVTEQTVSGGGADRQVATAFRVVHDHVTSAFRHEDLATALAATELIESDLDA